MVIYNTIVGFFTNWLSWIYLINFIVAMAIIFLERKNPSSTVAWIMVLYLIPVVGLFLYLCFSQNYARKKMFKLSVDEAEYITNSLKKQSKAINNNEYDFQNDAADKWVDLIRLNQAYGRAYYTGDNTISIYTDGKKKMDKLIEDILNAQNTVNVQYFIVKHDAVGKRLFDALILKAKEGLKVRLLVDAMGSRLIPHSWIRELESAGGEFSAFFPPKFKLINIRFNYRNHRKIVCIDEDLAYIGGFNIAKEYIGEKKKFGYWRDTHIRVEGGACQDINSRFMLDWRFSSNEKVDMSETFFPPERSHGNVGMQIVSSGPDEHHEEIKRGILRMISSAEKSIYIQTPYFVPDETILESIKMASQSGIDVRVMIPCMPDHAFVYWATYSYISEIIYSGGKVYVYNNGFLHAKTMTVDGEVCTVGSTNFDRRSFKLNFEANAFIYDVNTTKALEDRFKEDMEKSTLLTWEEYEKRGNWIKIKESISRLLSDIL